MAITHLLQDEQIRLADPQGSGLSPSTLGRYLLHLKQCKACRRVHAAIRESLGKKPLQLVEAK